MTALFIFLCSRKSDFFETHSVPLDSTDYSLYKGFPLNLLSGLRDATFQLSR